MEQQVRFYELLDHKLNELLSVKFIDKVVDLPLLKELKNEIQESISDIFGKSSHKLSDKALNWLSMQYFKSIRLNAEISIRDLIVSNEYELKELSFEEVQLLKNLFEEKEVFGQELVDELARRSAS